MEREWMTSLFSLEGKVALVTEAQPDDGLGTAVALARAGADVAVTAPDLELLAPTIADVQATGRRCLPARLDFLDLDSIQLAVDAVIAEFGRIDILVLNVGFNVPSWAVDVTPDEWERIVGINMTGPFFCAQAVGKQMLQAGYGRVITVGTHTAIKANVRRTAYGAARAGMLQYTRNLALEWAGSGVTVNSIAPAYIKPENLLKHPEMYEEMRGRNPMQRFATDDEVSAAIIFLASDAAAYITGQVLAVDGGSSL